MSFNPSQFKHVIEITLIKLQMHSDSAVMLLMGTSAVESQFGKYLRQLNQGPARGVFQMEPNTEKDIWVNYLRYKRGLSDMIFHTTGCIGPNVYHLEGNLIYQIAMARTHYRRVKESLPKVDDIEGLAEYWKQYYNTEFGAGRPEHFIKAFNKYCI